MPKSRCHLKTCPSSVIGRIPAAIIAYCAAALALSVPFLNAAGADIKNIASISSLNISWTSVIIGAVWILSGLLSTHERHENAIMCVLHACGLPGVLLGLLAIIK